MWKEGLVSVRAIFWDGTTKIQEYIREAARNDRLLIEIQKSDDEEREDMQPSWKFCPCMTCATAR